jgi:hypothetical protein
LRNRYFYVPRGQPSKACRGKPWTTGLQFAPQAASVVGQKAACAFRWLAPRHAGLDLSDNSGSACVIRKFSASLADL